MMWRRWFKKPGENAPVKEYWQATEAVSRPLAILLAIVVLFVCAALIFSLFIGGRWAYRKIFEHNDGVPEVVQVETSPSGVSGNASLGVQPDEAETPTITVTPTPTVSSPNTGAGSNIPNTGPEPE